MFGMFFLLGAEAIIEIGGIADHATFYTHAPAPVISRRPFSSAELFWDFAEYLYYKA